MGKGDINKHAQELTDSIVKSNFENVKKLIDGKQKKKDKDKFSFYQENDGEMNSDYQTAVLAAAQNDNSNFLQYLIEAKASVNFVLKDTIRGKVQKQIPLHAAVERGLTENVRLLLDANSNVNAVDHYGRTALHISVIKADCSTARMLLHRGANVHHVDQNGLSVLQIAAKYGHVELVRILLENYAQVFSPDQRGPSPLHIAAQEGHIPIIDMFSRFVDINIRMPCSPRGIKEEKAAIHLACERGLVETVRFLIERFQADVNSEDDCLNRPLHSAVLIKHDHRKLRRKEDFDLLVDMLIKKGADVNAKNKDGNTPLHLAAANDFHKIVELLLKAKASSSEKNNDKKTPMKMIPVHDKVMQQVFKKFSLIFKSQESMDLSTALSSSNSSLSQRSISRTSIDTSVEEEFQKNIDYGSLKKNLYPSIPSAPRDE